MYHSSGDISYIELPQRWHYFALPLKTMPLIEMFKYKRYKCLVFIFYRPWGGVGQLAEQRAC